MNILLVDDEPALIQMIADFLQSDGHNIQLAHDGQAALDIIKSWTPNLIISDVQMPVCNGFQMYKRLQEQNSDIPIIFISGYIGHDDNQLQNQKNILGFLSKPFKIQDLLNLIQQQSK